MKFKLYFLPVFLLSTYSFSQTPEVALRLSWFSQAGTARNQAIGGAMGSLGGDATAGLVNPAGLGFFKTSDFFITPAFQFNKEKSLFRGTDRTGNQQKSGMAGTSGLIFGGLGNRARSSFGITVTKTADFNKTTYYRGLNDYSSFAEPLADEFAQSGLTIDQALNNANISLQTKMALYTYLVDTARVNGNLQVIARSENPFVRDQEMLSESSGGITEINLGLGHEVNKKLMVGLSLGIPIVSLDRRTVLTESDASGNTNNDFRFLTYDERYTLKGIGVNLRGGIIYRPQQYIRLGLAFHSPSALYLKESLRSGMAVDVENLFSPSPGYDSVASSAFTSGQTTDTRYSLNSPSKIIISGSYVFREVSNIERQKGFISADIEYTNYKWLQFGPYEGEITSDTKATYQPFNDAIDALYKGAFNFRVGGELKFKIIMVRAGFAYYGSPYKDKSLKARMMNLSGGLGYRHKGIFVDLSYVHHLNKDVHFPYRVNAPRANTFASLRNTGGNVLLTLGFKI